MSRITLGIDAAERHEAAVRLLGRLRPEGAVVDAVHVISVPTSFFVEDYGLPTTEVIVDTLKAEETRGRRLGEEALRRLGGAGLTHGASQILFGAIPHELMEYADKTKSGLLAVGSEARGAARSFFTGSIGRALVIGAHQSILVARGRPAAEGPLRVVFATDHSGYMDACIPRFLELAPRGIAEVTVLTCYTRDFVRSIHPFLPEFVDDADQWVARTLAERNQKTIERLAPLGCTFASRVLEETPNEGIRKAMRESGADLLVIGAQGHGFIERLTLGSTSFHQVVAEPYPVLVLRIPGATLKRRQGVLVV